MSPGPDAAPVVAFLLRVGDEPVEWLERSLLSVLAQGDPRWELCLCEHEVRDPQTLRLLERQRGRDPRIKLLHAERRQPPAAVLTAAAEFATAPLVAELVAGDGLDGDTVRELAEALATRPDAPLFYSDEDAFLPNGRRAAPYLKPDWSPEHLLSAMYLGRLLAVRKSLFLALAEARAEAGAAADYALALRLPADGGQPVHLRRVLYHRREAAAPDESGLAARDLAADGAALARALAPRGLAVEPGLWPGSFRARWPLDSARPVTLLILTNARVRTLPGRGPVLLVLNFVRSILARGSYPNARILVVDDGLLPEAARAELLAAGVVIHGYAAEGPFNFSHKLNRALDFVETEDLVILNDDLEVIAPDWLEALLEQSRRPEIGAVGARLLFPDDTLQHAGIVLSERGGAEHLFYGIGAERPTHGGHGQTQRNYSAVTAAVMATRLSLLRAVGGFDESLRVDFNDVDYCLKLGELGYRVVYSPFATLYHFERSSLSRDAADPGDQARFLARWARKLADDPYYHPLLPRDRSDCRVAEW